jgi:hypothetical protein
MKPVTFIEIDDGYFLNPAKVTAIKAIGKKKCALFVDGQSALEGFVVERNALELAQEIADGAEGPAEADEDEDEEKEEED